MQFIPETKQFAQKSAQREKICYLVLIKWTVIQRPRPGGPHRKEQRQQ